MSGKLTKKELQQRKISLDKRQVFLNQYGKRLEGIESEHTAYYNTVIIPSFEKIAAKEAELAQRELVLIERLADVEKREAENWKYYQYVQEMEAYVNHLKARADELNIDIKMKQIKTKPVAIFSQKKLTKKLMPPTGRKTDS